MVGQGEKMVLEGKVSWVTVSHLLGPMAQATLVNMKDWADDLDVTIETNHHDRPIRNSNGFVGIAPDRGNSLLTIVTGPKYASSYTSIGETMLCGSLFFQLKNWLVTVG